MQADDTKLVCPLVFFLGLTNYVTNVNAKRAVGGGGIMGCRVQFQHQFSVIDVIGLLQVEAHWTTIYANTLTTK